MSGRESTRCDIYPGSALWPESLDELGGGIDCLHCIGDPELLESPCLSVIGARVATPYGLAIAEMSGRIAAECGITLVSGGARGCDSAAQRAALKAGGKIVIVAGTGADKSYPPTSRDIFMRAREGEGAVISLEEWGMEPRRHAFPKRNRIIAALSRALIVCEAGVPSGTFSTATCAAELGRIVYSVPGSIFSPSSRGTNQLIEQGALPIVDERSLEARISLDYGILRMQEGQGAETRRGRLLSALFASPCRSDELATRLGENVLDILRALTDFEAKGLVERLPDGRYSPTRQAYLLDNG